jgi:hypothetical protein
VKKRGGKILTDCSDSQIAEDLESVSTAQGCKAHAQGADIVASVPELLNKIAWKLASTRSGSCPMQDFGCGRDRTSSLATKSSRLEQISAAK